MQSSQLSKPAASAARNQNSIGDRMEKKTLGETRLSRGSVLLWPDEPAVCSMLQQSQIVQRTHLVPVVLSRRLSRRRGLHWGSVSGAHLGVLYTLSTSRNQMLVQSQCSCRFLVGSTGEPFKNRLLFHRLESQYRARCYVTEYVSCFVSLARPWQRQT